MADNSTTESIQDELLGPKLAMYLGSGQAIDEAVTANGFLRPGWQSIFEKIGMISQGELQRRLAQGDRQMEIDGIAFNPHDSSGTGSRPWALDPIPLVITEAEWQTVELGLEQRARLCDLILLDLLGPQTLLHEKVLPPEVLFLHKGFYPAFHSLVPRPRQHLHLYAADLARCSDGNWMVTADRSRCPFGLGYALENRLVTSRILPDAFDACRVRRLASFFITMQSTLRDLAPRFRENPRIAIWSKGPKSRTYFEDAFLARYLGYSLVEGDDLAVRNNRVMIKTLGGLLPVEVLLRRVEDFHCDPAELVPDSTTGITGLLEVIRSGNISVANSIGSNLAESPMLIPYLPKVCRHLLGEDLRLRSVPTWWGGSAEGRQYILTNFDKLIIREAFRYKDEAPHIVSMLSIEEKEKLKARFTAQPQHYVGQELVKRSTTPVWEDNKLSPWSLALRTFCIAKGDRYETMPGGLARVSPEANSLWHNMTSGEKTQDVWVLSEQKVAPVSLLNVSNASLAITRGGAELPSRAADNLFWLGRYIERAEQLARLVRITLQYVASREGTNESILPLVTACLEAKQFPSEITVGAFSQRQAAEIGQKLARGVLDPKNSFSLRNVVLAAEATATKVRDRIALDMLRIVNEVRGLLNIDSTQGEVAASEVISTLDSAIVQFSAASGLASENMTRTLGWRFLDMGRRIERAHRTAKNLVLLFPLQSQHFDMTRSLEMSLQVHDSFMTYRNRYLANFQLAAVLDLLIADTTNPRSITFQLNAIEQHVEHLPRPDIQALMSTEQRLAISMANSAKLIDVMEIAAPDKKGDFVTLHRILLRLLEQLPKLSDAVSARFLIHAGFQRHFASSPDPKPSNLLDTFIKDE